MIKRAEHFSHPFTEDHSSFPLLTSCMPCVLSCEITDMSFGAAQLYVHPADPEFLGFPSGSIFNGAVVRNLLPPGQYYYSYELVEGTRSLIAAALEGRPMNPCT